MENTIAPSRGPVLVYVVVSFLALFPVIAGKRQEWCRLWDEYGHTASLTPEPTEDSVKSILSLHNCRVPRSALSLCVETNTYRLYDKLFVNFGFFCLLAVRWRGDLKWVAWFSKSKVWVDRSTSELLQEHARAKGHCVLTHRKVNIQIVILSLFERLSIYSVTV